MLPSPSPLRTLPHLAPCIPPSPFPTTPHSPQPSSQQNKSTFFPIDLLSLSIKRAEQVWRKCSFCWAAVRLDECATQLWLLYSPVCAYLHYDADGYTQLGIYNAWGYSQTRNLLQWSWPFDLASKGTSTEMIPPILNTVLKGRFSCFSEQRMLRGTILLATIY